MKILFYDTKRYDKESFDKILPKYKQIEIEYTESDISVRTARYAAGFDAICAFVSSDLRKEVIEILAKEGIKLILMRCSGFNNVDLEAVKENDITILRVPGYSPEAVAEHAIALALASNRHIHKGYIIAYDIYQNPDLDFVEYVDLDTLLKESDLISLHCPLTEESYHMINSETISKMKDGVVLVNTSRGALIDTEDLIKGIRNHKFHSVGLDVYEEETENVFENREDAILQTSITSRLLSFPNVIVTSHQAFLTEEALEAISYTTLENAKSYMKNEIIEANKVEV